MTTRIRRLDSVRGLAALMVLMSHYSNETGLFGQLLGAGAGKIGVLLFFLLSGFLMSLLYIDRPFRLSTVSNYCVARVARVLPLYLFVVLMSYVGNGLGFTGHVYEIADMGYLISHLTLLYGDSVLWTIPPELHFYMIFVGLWFLYARSQDLFYLACALTLFLIVYFGFPKWEGKLGILPYDIKIFQVLPYFILGGVLGRLYATWTVPCYLNHPAALGLLIVLPLLYPIAYRHITGLDLGIGGLDSLNGVFLIGSLFFVLVFVGPQKSWLFNNCVGDFFGKISFSLYLLHLPVLSLLSAIAQSEPLLILPVFIAVSVLISVISYRVLEAPSRKAIKFFFSSAGKRDGET